MVFIWYYVNFILNNIIKQDFIQSIFGFIYLQCFPNYVLYGTWKVINFQAQLFER